jgi:hypothetical protein
MENRPQVTYELIEQEEEVDETESEAAGGAPSANGELEEDLFEDDFEEEEEEEAEGEGDQDVEMEQVDDFDMEGIEESPRAPVNPPPVFAQQTYAPNMQTTTSSFSFNQFQTPSVPAPTIAPPSIPVSQPFAQPTMPSVFNMGFPSMQQQSTPSVQSSGFKQQQSTPSVQSSGFLPSLQPQAQPANNAFSGFPFAPQPSLSLPQLPDLSSIIPPEPANALFGSPPSAPAAASVSADDVQKQQEIAVMESELESLRAQLNQLKNPILKKKKQMEVDVLEDKINKRRNE